METLHFLQYLTFESASYLCPTRVGLLQLEQTIMTFDMCIGRGADTISPFCPCCFGFTRFLYKLRPSTEIFSINGKTFKTGPVFPRSFPKIICTVSPFLIFIPFRKLKPAPCDRYGVHCWN